jgi:hypothetical protein
MEKKKSTLVSKRKEKTEKRAEFQTAAVESLTFSRSRCSSIQRRAIPIIFTLQVRWQLRRQISQRAQNKLDKRGRWQALPEVFQSQPRWRSRDGLTCERRKRRRGIYRRAMAKLYNNNDRAEVYWSNVCAAERPVLLSPCSPRSPPPPSYRLLRRRFLASCGREPLGRPRRCRCAQRRR